MAEKKAYFVYVLSSRKHGTLYIGVTSNMLRRVWEHKRGCVPGFTRRYGVNHLVYYEAYESPEAAICREKAMKKWKREWKISLIEKHNPEWVDLFHTLPQ